MGWIFLIISMLHQVPQILSPSYSLGIQPFSFKVNVVYSTIGCEHGLSKSIQHIGALVHTPMATTIDATISADTGVYLLGTFMDNNSGIDFILLNKTIYIPASLIRIFLVGYLPHIS